jgi:hypothetical protein
MDGIPEGKRPLLKITVDERIILKLVHYVRIWAAWN